MNKGPKKFTINVDNNMLLQSAAEIVDDMDKIRKNLVKRIVSSHHEEDETEDYTNLAYRLGSYILKFEGKDEMEKIVNTIDEFERKEGIIDEKGRRATHSKTAREDPLFYYGVNILKEFYPEEYKKIGESLGKLEGTLGLTDAKYHIFQGILAIVQDDDTGKLSSPYSCLGLDEVEAQLSPKRKEEWKKLESDKNLRLIGQCTQTKFSPQMTQYLQKLYGEKWIIGLERAMFEPPKNRTDGIPGTYILGKLKFSKCWNELRDCYTSAISKCDKFDVLFSYTHDNDKPGIFVLSYAKTKDGFMGADYLESTEKLAKELGFVGIEIDNISSKKFNHMKEKGYVRSDVKGGTGGFAYGKFWKSLL